MLITEKQKFNPGFKSCEKEAVTSIERKEVRTK